VRVPISDVSGIAEGEVERIIAGRPYVSLSDVWHRAGLSRPTAERLVVAGAFDAMYRLDVPERMRPRDHLTRRDLLLQIADLERWGRSGRGQRRGRRGSGRARGTTSSAQLPLMMDDLVPGDVVAPSGLPEMTAGERVQAELEVLGMDVSRHVVDFHSPMLEQLRIAGMRLVSSRELLRQRSRSEIFVAGVKVAVQTPPVRSGRRVIFLTLDDSTGPVDAAFFDDAQGPFASTVFSSWLLLVRGVLRRTGPRGVSIRATGCWDLGEVRQVWQCGGSEGVRELIDEGGTPRDEDWRQTSGDPGHRRVLVHASGFRQSPYADVKPAGATRMPSSGLWHASPGVGSMRTSPITDGPANSGRMSP
jgi:error-prone DNA polymerase